MIKTILFKFAMFIWLVIMSPIMVIALVSEKFTLSVVQIATLGVLWLARIIAGIRYEIHYPALSENGIPVIPNENNRVDGKAIIAAKHMSTLEVAILKTHIPNSFFIVKRELFWIPVVGWSFWRMGLQPINRDRGATNMKKLLNEVAKKIMDGRILIIFPEGTRTSVGQKVKLKRGLLFIAESLKLPIYPVGTDTGLYWPKKGRMKGGTAHLYFEKILPCSASLPEIAESIARHSA